MTTAIASHFFAANGNKAVRDADGRIVVYPTSEEAQANGPDVIAIQDEDWERFTLEEEFAYSETLTEKIWDTAYKRLLDSRAK